MRAVNEYADTVMPLARATLPVCTYTLDVLSKYSVTDVPSGAMATFTVVALATALACAFRSRGRTARVPPGSRRRELELCHGGKERRTGTGVWGVGGH